MTQRRDWGMSCKINFGAQRCCRCCCWCRWCCSIHHFVARRGAECNQPRVVFSMGIARSMFFSSVDKDLRNERRSRNYRVMELLPGRKENIVKSSCIGNWAYPLPPKDTYYYQPATQLSLSVAGGGGVFWFMAVGRVWKCVLQNYKLYVLTGTAPINPPSRSDGRTAEGHTVTKFFHRRYVKAIPLKWLNGLKLIHLPHILIDVI